MACARTSGEKMPAQIAMQIGVGCIRRMCRAMRLLQKCWLLMGLMRRRNPEPAAPWCITLHQSASSGLRLLCPVWLWELVLPPRLQFVSALSWDRHIQCAQGKSRRLSALVRACGCAVRSRTINGRKTPADQALGWGQHSVPRRQAHGFRCPPLDQPHPPCWLSTTSRLAQTPDKNSSWRASA